LHLVLPKVPIKNLLLVLHVAFCRTNPKQDLIQINYFCIKEAFSRFGAAFGLAMMIANI